VTARRSYPAPCKLRIKPGCRLATIYGASEIDEEYFCNFEVNPQYRHRMEKAGLCPVALGPNGELRAVELPDHRFFVATLYQPQLSSTEARPHPVIVEFVAAASR
jgi:CTP synthase (UTP-ammonia lyase)